MTLLDEHYPVNKDDFNYYQKNGHLCLRNVCPLPELEIYRSAINATTADMKRQIQKTPLEERTTYGQAFLQMCNLWVMDETVKRFVMAKRFAQIAAKLLNVERVRLYHDQALYKEAGGGFTPWHQDQHYWPLDCDRTITMWMPLVDVTKDMGTLNFASLSHRVGYLGDIPISDDSEEYLDQYCKDNGFETINHGAMEAGDATFHNGWTLHGAMGNKSQQLREVMTIIYYPDNTGLLPEPDPLNRWNDNRRDDLESWFPGCKPGDLAKSELTPLL
ncbi:MAG: phytanoyl-CoA dioxygenase family protein [Lentisphaeria bacterium]|nr:phytanoyl-CoA dioxygenase family protein [Lentisphaeria bacterium]